MRILRCNNRGHFRALTFILLTFLLMTTSLVASDFVADKDNACRYEPATDVVQQPTGEVFEDAGSRAPYQGVLKIYVVEPVSSFYDDYNGAPYNNAFLDFAYDTALNLEYQQEFNRTIEWDPAQHGWSGITEGNIKVIAVLYNHIESHHAYSDPPSGGHFLAYYADAAAAAEPGETGQNEAGGDYTHTVFLEEGTSGG